MTVIVGCVFLNTSTDMSESRVTQAENDNGDAGLSRDDALLFRPSWIALFLPTAIIAVGYALVFGVFVSFGRGDGALARLCIAVLVLGVPLLLANATLRYFTILVRLSPDTVIVHQGFPRRDAREVAHSHIRAVHVSQGFVGRLTNSGTLMLELVTGQRVAIADLTEPFGVKLTVERLLDGGGDSAEAMEPVPGPGITRAR